MLPSTGGGDDNGDCSGGCGEVAPAAAALGPLGLLETGVRGGAGEGARVTPTGAVTEAALKGVPPLN